MIARLLALSLCLLLSVPALADSPQTGILEGQVLDAEGGALPGVTVTLETPRGDRTAVTDGDGFFRFGNLPPGSYRLQAELEGFAPAVTGSLRLETGQRQVQSLTLGLATEETIQVTAEAPLVNKYEVSTNATIESEVAEELSFAHRHYQSLITSLPGVVQDSVSQDLADHRPSMNGGMWQEAGAFIDGVDTSNTRRGGSSRMFLPTSALAEVRADGSGYGAEYGRVTGGVTGAVTKSGTNTFHGDFLYVAQNPKWTAENENVAIDRPDDVESNFEASLGGPVKRDKAWFFVAASEGTTNRPSALASGEQIDLSANLESRIAKISVQPSVSHSAVVTWIDAPVERPFFAPIYAERATVSIHDLGGDFATANWNWSISNSQFLETRFATQDSSEGRTCCVEVPPIDPNASPDDPAGNNGAYWDLNTSFRYHSAALPLGPGELNFPRDQLNAALTWFAGSNNELKLGIDFQDVEWETVNRPPDRYQGRGYNPNLPGGFVQPVRKRVFIPIDSPSTTQSENLAAFVQDRITWGDHWTLSAGVRLEDQEHENDVGEVGAESTDLAPRLAAIYDVRGDGNLLVKGTAGRYYVHIPQNIVNAEFSRLPNGANAFDQFAWNPATGLYDIFQFSFLPATNTVIRDFDPYHKDEVTLGVEYQFDPRWAFKARGIWWELDDIYTATNQLSPDGSTVIRVVDNISEATRDYIGLQLELNRSFRNGWVLRSNWTISEAEGNVFGNSHFTSDDDDFLEFRDILTDDCVSCPAIAAALGTAPLPSGIPLTAANRFGRADQDSTHIVNVSGAKTWSVGAHDVTLGGFVWYRTGFPWGLRPVVTLGAADGLPSTERTTVFFEPRDAHELPDTFNLNLQGSWQFPLSSRVDGSLRVEVANLTDEQKQIAVNPNNGNPIPVGSSWQKPRELRLLAGVRF